MIYRLITTARSVRPLVLPIVPRTLSNGFELEVEREGASDTYRIVLSKRVAASREQMPSLVPDENGIPTLTFPDHIHRRDGVLFLQYMEAAGYFLIGIQEVGWQTPKEEWVPETPEERQIVQIPDWVRTDFDFPVERGISQDLALDDLCENFSGWAQFTVPLNMVQHGFEAYRRRKFFDAVVFLYLYVEGMYANGKTGNKAVKAELRKAQYVRQAIAQFLHNIVALDSRTHQKGLARLLKEFGHPGTVDGIIDLLVDFRGAVFHYTRRGQRRTANPSRPIDYFTPAYLLQSIAMLTLCSELPAAAVRPLE